jgi:hypothetical protein
MLDAIAAELLGLDGDDLRRILADCDHPVSSLQSLAFRRELDPKGFWRVDKEKDPELRHTVLTVSAFEDLKSTIAAHGGIRDQGMASFCGQNEGEGWMLPEALCLADLGLGHDERARHPQPVRQRLGSRFYDFQLAQSAADSWKECELHARNLLGEVGFAQLQRELETPAVREPARRVAEPVVRPYGSGSQSDLFP